MPVKPTKAPLARFMALFFAMLIAFSAMRMASADALPVTSQALDTMNVVHTHYLRSTADVSTSEQGNIGGERRLVIGLAGLEGLSARLRQSWSTITSRIRVQWWLWRQQTKSPDDAFKSLQLHKVEGSVFKNPKFLAWKYFVEKTNLEGDAFRVMFDSMERVFGSDAALAKVLGQAKGSQGDTVERLRDYQIERWVERQVTVDTLFNHLKLNIEPASSLQVTKQFDSPEFAMWGAFITKKKSGLTALEKARYHRAFELLSKQNGKYVDLMKGLAVIRKNDENYHFAQGLLYVHLQDLQSKNTVPSTFFKDMKLEKPWRRKLWFQSLGLWLEKKGLEKLGRWFVKRWNIKADDEELVRVWLDYVYMRSLDKDGSISSDQVSIALDNVLGKYTGSRMMELCKAELKPAADRLTRLSKQYDVPQEKSNNPTA